MKRVYISSAAQFDNLGDLILRRTALEWARTDEVELRVFVGDAPAEYVEGLKLPPESRVYRSLVRFYLDFLGAPGDMWWSPGEQRLAYDRKNLLHASLSVVSASWARATGHRAIKIGRSYTPSDGGTLLPFERLLARLLTVHVVRDVTSAQLLRRARLLPDIALGSDLLAAEQAGARTPATGPTGVLSFRSDRPSATTGVEAMVERLAALPIAWTSVSQVRRDEAFNAALARRAGGVHQAWSTDHDAQLAALLDLYRRADVVVSDRLHVVLFAVAMGTPVIGIDTGSGKMRRHLEVLDLADRCFTPHELLGCSDDELAALRADGDVVAARTSAQARLASVKRELQVAA